MRVSAAPRHNTLALPKTLRESVSLVAVLAVLFCLFFWSGFFLGRTTARPGGFRTLSAPEEEPAIPVNLAAG